MSCYYIIPVRLDEHTKRSTYDRYIGSVQALAAQQGVRLGVSCGVQDSVGEACRPERSLVLEFGDIGLLRQFFALGAYRAILDMEVRRILKGAYIRRMQGEGLWHMLMGQGRVS